jgi:hypothetical protein
MFGGNILRFLSALRRVTLLTLLSRSAIELCAVFFPIVLFPGFLGFHHAPHVLRGFRGLNSCPPDAAAAIQVTLCRGKKLCSGRKA